MRLNVRPGVELPPPSRGDPSPWMAKRPGGIRAFMQTIRTYDLDREALARFDRSPRPRRSHIHVALATAIAASSQKAT